MTPFAWRDDSAFKPTHEPCPACNDTWEITYGDDSVICPLHGGPLAKMPTDVAKRIQRNVERELGIQTRLVITARGWLLAGLAAIALWIGIIAGVLAIVKALS